MGRQCVLAAFPEKSQSESILSKLPLYTHMHTPSCSYGSCWLILLTAITCHASAIIGCYLERQEALSPWIQGCGYDCAAFQSGFPTDDIRSERTRNFKTAQIPRCCSHLFICVTTNKGNWGWLLVLPLESIFQSLREWSWVRQGISPFLCTTARWACK